GGGHPGLRSRGLHVGQPHVLVAAMIGSVARFSSCARTRSRTGGSSGLPPGTPGVGDARGAAWTGRGSTSGPRRYRAGTVGPLSDPRAQVLPNGSSRPTVL